MILQSDVKSNTKMMFDKNTVAARLKELRGPISQAEMARQVGIAQQGWARYESGKVVPGAEALHQICESSGVSADWILGLSDTKKSKSTTKSVSENVTQLRAAAAKVCSQSDAFMEAVEKLKAML